MGKYMIRPLLSLERLSFDEKKGQVSYRYGKEGGELEQMDYLEFIARVTSHIPDKSQVMVRPLRQCSPIINHLKLTFVAERPPPPHISYPELLIAAEAKSEYFL